MATAREILEGVPVSLPAEFVDKLNNDLDALYKQILNNEITGKEAEKRRVEIEKNLEAEKRKQALIAALENKQKAVGSGTQQTTQQTTQQGDNKIGSNNVSSGVSTQIQKPV